jgi:hypothetical protein
MPGGTASNIVAYIARGDMPLSIMMTTASTIMAVFTTPLLTSLLVGTLVPVDARAMFMSVLQLVLAPVIVGTAANQLFPRVRRAVGGWGGGGAFFRHQFRGSNVAVCVGCWGCGAGFCLPACLPACLAV